MRGIVDRVESEVREKEPPSIDREEGRLLAAALAAALVEYRRNITQGNDDPDQDGDKANWRIVGRLEQLRSPA